MPRQKIIPTHVVFLTSLFFCMSSCYWIRSVYYYLSKIFLKTFPLNVLNGYGASYSFLATIIAFLVSAITFLLLFTKKGIQVENKDTFSIAYFLFHIVLYKKEVKIKNYPSISLLKHRMRRKVGGNIFSSGPLQELEHPFMEYRICLLNKQHTIKETILCTEKEDLAKKVIKLLVEKYDFREEIYSPDFD